MRARGRAKIYKLIDPRNGDVKYIGQTSRKLSLRLSQHISDPCSIKMKAWVEELKKENLTPVPEIIELGIRNRKLANDREQYWLEYYRKYSGLLLNSKTSPRA